ncbi:MAG TPA: AraC family transcriptional regulator [Puia sp.]|nr:AraC family transcriptional regulator [Puia sp.]
MYFTSLPDHNAPGFDEKEHFSKFSRHNVVYHALSHESHCDDHVGCLSLKTIFSGEEWYRFDGHELAIRRGRFLILNDDQTYACRINKGPLTHVLSVFFQKEFAASVFHDELLLENQLLDDPFDHRNKKPEFFQTLHTVEPTLAGSLSNLITGLDSTGDDQERTDEKLIFLLGYLLRTHGRDSRLAQRVDAVKPATKKEIYRRLCVAKDILHSCFRDPVDLAGLSRQVFLSRPQLIRQFRSVFGRTPYQYLIDIRLRHAAESLLETLSPVREIAWHSGFIDPSAFCRAFRTAYGVSPEQFRARRR